ncbi:glutaredoxin family protein [Candidatus Saccharibacteria bacterium]|nr:glutaredoxin family protein [Candidatus Saccharibacteria bacterium]
MATNSPTIQIYTTPTCVYCHALMDWLDEKGIKYTEFNALDPSTTNDREISSVPFTVISSGSQIVAEIQGFDRHAFKKALKPFGLL